MIYSSYNYRPNTSSLTASSAKAAASSAKSAVESVSHEVERLLMITEALWDILKEKHGYSDDDLMRRVAEIDMKDGKLDGKVAKTGPASCPKCSRPMNRRHSACIYCGEQIVQHPFGR